jgi:D-arabinose 1-dehydrogenase-like Zn-dependent alcohol dehydrogenase
MELAASGRLDLDAAISRRFELTEADEAYRRLAEGDIVGRAIVEML